MKSRSEIWASVALDVATLCSAQTARDVETVTRRVATEGDAFFKATLPQFAKDLERSLEDRLIDPTSFVGFRRRARSITVFTKQKKLRHGTPIFLGDLMNKLFDDSYEVSRDEYLDAQAASEAAFRPLAEFFPPRLREPQSQEELREMAEAIMAIRQLCLMFAKESDVYTDESVNEAVEKYKSCDEELMAPFTTDASMP